MKGTRGEQEEKEKEEEGHTPQLLHVQLLEQELPAQQVQSLQEPILAVVVACRYGFGDEREAESGVDSRLEGGSAAVRYGCVWES